MKITLRGWFLVGTFAAIVLALVLFGSPILGHAAAPPPGGQSPGGQLSEDDLGKLLKAMGLKIKKEKQRYDFGFKAIHGGKEWELSMSAVLSSDRGSIWVMAWLDELPRSAAEVPRTALLRLLALNDRLGSGKFFAYVAGNRRFVLQRVVPNENISTAGFARTLQDLGASVMETHPYWTVAGWNGSSESEGEPPPPRTATGGSRFQPRSRN